METIVQAQSNYFLVYEAEGKVEVSRDEVIAWCVSTGEYECVRPITAHGENCNNVIGYLTPSGAIIVPGINTFDSIEQLQEEGGGFPSICG